MRFLLLAMCSVGVLLLTTSLLQGAEAPGSDAGVPFLPSSPDSIAGDRVVVTYFHRTFRCETCLSFERNSWDALRTAFPDELESGRLVWRVLDMDEDANVHYAEDYGLFESSLVVAIEAGGREIAWKLLGDIWGLTEDRQAFLDYVTLEVYRSLEDLSRREHGSEVGEADTTRALPLHR